MEFWIARDVSGLWLYSDKPEFNPDKNEYESFNGDILVIDNSLFPEVTVENSPQKVKIELIKE